MIKVCESWTFEQLSELNEAQMDGLLNEGWDKNMHVPSYEDLGGKLPPFRYVLSQPPTWA